jgi:hypothetical protein
MAGPVPAMTWDGCELSLSVLCGPIAARVKQTLTGKKEGFAIWTIAKPFKQEKRLP